MRAPTVEATIERRILVNYRVDPGVLAAVLPAPFRPALVDGYGLAGICLIRLAAIRPAGLPAALGLTAENAAHRMAVEWDPTARDTTEWDPTARDTTEGDTTEGEMPGGTTTGVYIPRRDTSSRLAAMLGGRAFPGWQHLARFDVEEAYDRFRVHLVSRDREVEVGVSARRSATVMAGSVFPTLDAASAFFRDAPVGYAATPVPGVFDGVELATREWHIEPLQVERVRSSFFDDPARFPTATAVLDSAFLMTNLATTWQPQPPLLAGRGAVAPAAP